jgi:hypothetical protein
MIDGGAPGFHPLQQSTSNLRQAEIIPAGDAPCKRFATASNQDLPPTFWVVPNPDAQSPALPVAPDLICRTSQLTVLVILAIRDSPAGWSEYLQHRCRGGGFGSNGSP